MTSNTHVDPNEMSSQHSADDESDHSNSATLDEESSDHSNSKTVTPDSSDRGSDDAHPGAAAPQEQPSNDDEPDRNDATPPQEEQPANDLEPDRNNNDAAPQEHHADDESDHSNDVTPAASPPSSVATGATDSTQPSTVLSKMPLGNVRPGTAIEEQLRVEILRLERDHEQQVARLRAANLEAHKHAADLEQKNSELAVQLDRLREVDLSEHFVSNGDFENLRREKEATAEAHNSAMEAKQQEHEDEKAAMQTEIENLVSDHQQQLQAHMDRAAADKEALEATIAELVAQRIQDLHDAEETQRQQLEEQHSLLLDKWNCRRFVLRVLPMLQEFAVRQRHDLEQSELEQRRQLQEELEKERDDTAHELIFASTVFRTFNEAAADLRKYKNDETKIDLIEMQLMTKLQTPVAASAIANDRKNCGQIALEKTLTSVMDLHAKFEATPAQNGAVCRIANKILSLDVNKKIDASKHKHSRSKTPFLFIAISIQGDGELCQGLLDRGCDLVTTDDKGDNAITFAARTSRTQFLQWLREEMRLPADDPAWSHSSLSDDSAITLAAKAGYTTVLDELSKVFAKDHKAWDHCNNNDDDIITIAVLKQQIGVLNWLLSTFGKSHPMFTRPNAYHEFPREFAKDASKKWYDKHFPLPKKKWRPF